MYVDKQILDIKKAKIDPLYKDEIFVWVKDTKNYWISNYGRLASNLRGKYKLHKFNETKITHYTITCCFYDNSTYTKEAYTDDLVANAFLDSTYHKGKIWHIDKNKGNNYYKNLAYVSNEEEYKLRRGLIEFQDLHRNQDYIPYVTNKGGRAYQVWNSMYLRCYDSDTKTRFPHYADAYMCDSWKKDPVLFAEWYEANYYECVGESMQVDKDLLCSGNKEYSAEKCCILPQTLNNMLSNCIKHYFRSTDNSKKNNTLLPLGVAYDKDREKYFSHIKMNAQLSNEHIVLGYFDNPEDAFEIYKKHKQAYILMMADKYKNYIPKYIYEALLKVEITPY